MLFWMLVLAAAMFIGLVMWAIGRQSQLTRDAEADAPRLLAELFNGNRQVMYKRPMGGLTDETLLAGAARYGYKLDATGKDGGLVTYLFSKR